MGWRPAWPGQVCSLGEQVAEWIEAFCCHGPGDVAGRPVTLDTEFLGFLERAYELDPTTGRRLFDEAVLSRPKGRAKSELAGLVATAEAFGPVRFDGWDTSGQPVGRPVRSPLIKCLATEELQAGNTFEVIAFVVAEWGPDEHPEVFGGVSGVRQYQSARAIYLPQGGEIRACTSGAASKDGGKESFVVADETHLYILREQKSMYSTIARNLGSKRMESQPWLLQTTTGYRPGEQSTAEETLTAYQRGELSPAVLVDHREASGPVDLDDREHTLRQLAEVFGPAAVWQDLGRKYRDMRDPRICPDVATAARYYLNRSMAAADGWIPADVVDRQGLPVTVDDGDWIALGFDGSLNEDSTVLIGSRMSDGFLWPVGMWEKPRGFTGAWWEVDRPAVLATIRDTFDRFRVTRAYADPHEWRSDIDQLQVDLGERIFPWPTSRDAHMAAALDRLHTDLCNGEVFHDDDRRMVAHFGNAYVRWKGRFRLVRKEYDGSPRKIDAVVGAALAYEARADALAAGWTPEPPPRQKLVVMTR